MVAPTAIHPHDVTISTKLNSGKKIDNKPKYEIDEICKKGDIDNPEQYVSKTYYKHRDTSPHAVFQIIQYESGEIKHVPCKTCNSQYQYKSATRLDDLFFLDFTSRNEIECLPCHAKFKQ